MRNLILNTMADCDTMDATDIWLIVQETRPDVSWVEVSDILNEMIANGEIRECQETGLIMR